MNPDNDYSSLLYFMAVQLGIGGISAVVLPGLLFMYFKERLRHTWVTRVGLLGMSLQLLVYANADSPRYM